MAVFGRMEQAVSAVIKDLDNFVYFMPPRAKSGDFTFRGTLRVAGHKRWVQLEAGSKGGTLSDKGKKVEVGGSFLIIDAGPKHGGKLLRFVGPR